MENILYSIVGFIAKVHTILMAINDAREQSFTDKELHFIVLGVIGLIMVFVLYPLFKFLAKTGHTMVIVFFYVTTVLIVIAFAIEIGQRVTGTGIMEFDDIVYGIAGFLAMFIVFCVIRGIYHLIRKAIKKDEDEWYN